MTPFRVFLAAYRHSMAAAEALNRIAARRVANDVTGAELREACDRAEIASNRLAALREAFGR